MHTIKKFSVLILALAFGHGLAALAHPTSSRRGPAEPMLARQYQGTVSVPSIDNFLLPDISQDRPQTRYYTFVVENLQGAPDGVSRPMVVVNGSYPGPTIHANSYDTLSITVINSLSPGTGTTIHWHGIYQNGTNYYDGTSSITQCPIPPNESLTYTFPLQGFSGTTWWHAHYGTQYTDGVVGAIIVQEPTSVDPVYDAEVVVQMSDWYHNTSDVLLEAYFSPTGIDGEPGDEPVPDAGVINGLGQYNGLGSFFNFSLALNTTYRFRLINTGSLADIIFSIDNHPLTVIAADSVAVQPLQVANVTLAVAQRYDVLVTTNQTGGAFWMRSTLSKDMFTYSQPGAQDNQLAILRYGTSGSAMPPTSSSSTAPALPLPALNTALLVPAQAINPPAATMQVPVSFNLDGATAYMNGTSWKPLQNTSTLMLLHNSTSPSTFLPEGPAILNPDQLILTVDSLQTVDIILENNDNGGHPFHMHGHQLWLMASGPGSYSGNAQLNTINPMRRDTQLIAANSWAILRFVTDNPGFWAFHCHIAWHASAGLLMQISSRPSLAAQFVIPPELITQCAADTPVGRGG